MDSRITAAFAPSWHPRPRHALCSTRSRHGIGRNRTSGRFRCWHAPCFARGSACTQRTSALPSSPEHTSRTSRTSQLPSVTSWRPPARKRGSAYYRKARRPFRSSSRPRCSDEDRRRAGQVPRNGTRGGRRGRDRLRHGSGDRAPPFTKGAAMSDLLDRLDARLAKESAVVTAYSGGVDSALLAVAAQRVLGRRALAATAVSASLPARARRAAREFARDHGLRHVEVCTDELDRTAYVRNSGDRCAHCKSALFDQL